MRKVWLIAEHHFLKEARSRTFILALFALPLLLAVTTGYGYLFSRLRGGPTTLGYVDTVGLVRDPQAGPEHPDVTLVEFETPDDAHQALEAGQIDAYYLLPAAAGTRQTSLVYFEPPPIDAARTFQDLVRRNQMAGQPPLLIERVLGGASVTVRADETNREYPGGDPTVALFLPLIAAAVFGLLVMTTVGYLGEAVVTEKENRTIEVIVTSVSAGRLMMGKILGGLGIALLQLLVWIGCLVLTVAVGGGLLHVEWLQHIDPNWRDVAMVVVVALPTYLLLAALITALGATLVDSQEVQQLGGLAFLLLFLPIYLVIPLSREPNGPLALALSFFPLTSVSTLAVRSLLAEVPAWQVAAAAAVALAGALLTSWLAGKAFRLNMLRYGQRMRRRAFLPGLARRARTG